MNYSHDFSLGNSQTGLNIYKGKKVTYLQPTYFFTRPGKLFCERYEMGRVHGKQIHYLFKDVLLNQSDLLKFSK